jgi:lipoprotein-anchoring transpeptidase ErfK/SrfK
MNDSKIARRGLVLGGLALMVSGCMPALRQAGVANAYAFPVPGGPDPRFRRQRVEYTGSEQPGTIVVDTSDFFLYAVEEGGRATRYGVAVGEKGLTFKGRATVGRKEEWPAWTPTAAMVQRKPRLLQYAGGVPGGPNNPLGARALYLYQGPHDTMFRIHGTNEPWLIGTAVSNGCIRLTNDDIIDLYDRTPLGTKVLVI